jgi:hypothetical protein
MLAYAPAGEWAGTGNGDERCVPKRVMPHAIRQENGTASISATNAMIAAVL